MQFGLIGRGKLGGNMGRRLRRAVVDNAGSNRDGDVTAGRIPGTPIRRIRGTYMNTSREVK
jgi:6-phosphogluconate dehydrogenase (decarboxylating)